MEHRVASSQVLIRKCMALIKQAILEAAVVRRLAEALEAGHQACIESARAGITAFKGKRSPYFSRTK